MKLSLLLATSILGLALLASQTIYGQDTEPTLENKESKTAKAEVDAKKAIERKFEEMQQLVDAHDYDGLASHLSQQAQDQISIGVVEAAVISVRAAKRIKADLERQYGEEVDSTKLGASEELVRLIQEHGLENILDRGKDGQKATQANGVGDDSSKDDATTKEAEAKESKQDKKKQDSAADSSTRGSQEKTSDENKKGPVAQARESREARILEALDRNKNRWEIVSEISKATTSQMRTYKVMTGEVTAIELGDDGQSAKVTVKAVSEKTMENRNSLTLRVQGLERIAVIDVTMKNGEWVHNGQNEGETLKAMNDHVKDFSEKASRRRRPAKSEY